MRVRALPWAFALLVALALLVGVPLAAQAAGNDPAPTPTSRPSRLTS